MSIRDFIWRNEQPFERILKYSGYYHRMVEIRAPLPGEEDILKELFREAEEVRLNENDIHSNKGLQTFHQMLYVPGETENVLIDIPNSATLSDRKVEFIQNPPSSLQLKIISTADEALSQIRPLPGPETIDVCWMFPVKPNDSAIRSITRTLKWHHENGFAVSLCVPLGLILLLFHDPFLLEQERLTLEQKMGWACSRWELSHLCGNWTCINPFHLTLESKHINLERNRCFRSSKNLCQHAPQCLKSLKNPVDSLVSGILTRQDMDTSFYGPNESTIFVNV